jgi:hypothetical protein
MNELIIMIINDVDELDTTDYFEKPEVSNLSSSSIIIYFLFLLLLYLLFQLLFQLLF